MSQFELFPDDYFEKSYLSSQLIPYIGNKRGILDFLQEVFSRISESHPAGRFLDPFAGTGAVSRLARYMGFQVEANDWEPYSWVINSCYLTINKRELKSLFHEKGGVKEVFNFLNTLDQAVDPYISRYWAPKDTQNADYRRERLFYTRGNALFIDRVRSKIEEWYPGGDLRSYRQMDEQARKEKVILLASLLYEAAKHVNTSGVFKACHKGFGGHGRDALRRILSPMELEIPVLIDRSIPSLVECENAADFVRGRSADLCYLDPPYNGHQYGSNYHLLNTIALWDKPEVSEELDKKMTLKDKAGIRKDWVKTRSRFCYRDTAPSAFRELLEGIDAKTVVLSYNTEGIVPLEELLEIMSKQGDVELLSRDYVKYRGGKQSINRKIHNVEFVIILKREERQGKYSGDKIERFLIERDIISLLREPFSPNRLCSTFPVVDNRVVLLEKDGHIFSLPMEHFYRFSEVPTSEAFLGYERGELRLLKKKLSRCLCHDRMEEIDVILSILRKELVSSELKSYQKTLLTVLKKFAHKKYKKEFFRALEKIKRLLERHPACFRYLSKSIPQIEELANRRLNG
ncbi:MAG: DNA methyltransferase [Spirochaetes bacterium]|nr:MAG: DNA methyltransferase [Spirochaetota bacterium]